MKCQRRLLSAIVALLHAFALAQPSAGNPNERRRISPGVVENSQYRNEFLEFSYPIPEGWQVNEDLVRKDQETANEQGRRGALILLVLDQHTGRNIKNRIVMGAAEPENPALTPLEAISTLMNRAKDQ